MNKIKKYALIYMNMKHLNILFYASFCFLQFNTLAWASDALSISEEQSSSASSSSYPSFSRTPSPDKKLTETLTPVMTEERSQHFIELFNRMEKILTKLEGINKMIFREQAGGTTANYITILKDLHKPLDPDNLKAAVVKDAVQKHIRVIDLTLSLISDTQEYATTIAPLKIAKIHKIQDPSAQYKALEGTYRIFKNMNELVQHNFSLLIHILKNSHIALHPGEYDPNNYGDKLNPNLDWLRSSKDQFDDLDTQFHVNFPKNIKKIKKAIKKYPSGKTSKTE